MAVGAGAVGWEAGVVVAANPRLGKFAIILKMLDPPAAPAGLLVATKQYQLKYWYASV